MTEDELAGPNGNVTEDKQAGPDGNVAEEELAGPDETRTEDELAGPDGNMTEDETGGGNKTKTRGEAEDKTGKAETKNRTEDKVEEKGGDFEFGQDCFQLHQDENTTKTKATGGIETDTRTSGDYKHGQDGVCDFQQG